MANRASESTIREIAGRISILDLISPHVELTKSGKYLKGLCPFHTEKTPSFTVNPERNTFYCFGCNEGGDLYSFYMKFHNLPFPDALEQLARKAGVSLEGRQRPRDPGKEQAYKKGVELNRCASDFFQRTLLQSNLAQAARDYLRARGVKAETIQEFRLGFDPSGDRLYQAFSARPDAVEMATQVGLVVPDQQGRGYYDRFYNRLMFPIMDTTGQVLGFGGRTLGASKAKYINSPESFLYRKGSMLYGLHCAQKHLREQDSVILVEGYFDLITLAEHGFRNSVAVLGTALTDAQIDLAKRYTRNFVLVFDGDEAGKKASFRNLPSFVQKGLPAKAVYLPKGEDPDSFVRKHGAQALRNLLDQAIPIVEAYFDEKTRGLSSGDPIGRKVATARELLPIIRQMPDKLEQSLRLRQLSEKLSIAEHILAEEMARTSRNERLKGEGKIRTPEPQGHDMQEKNWPAEEKLVFQVLAQFPSLVPDFLEAKILQSFRSPALKDVLEALGRQFTEMGDIELSEIVGHREKTPLWNALARLACKGEFSHQEARTALRDSMRRILERTFRERCEHLNSQIREAERTRKTHEYDRLLLEKKQLLEEKKALFLRPEAGS